MHRCRSLTLIAAVMMAGSTWGSPQLPTIDAILPKIRTNLRTNLQVVDLNIACNLRETMELSFRGNLRPQWSAEWIIGGRGRTNPLPAGTIRWFKELVSYEGNAPGYVRLPQPTDPVPAPSPVVDNIFLFQRYDLTVTGIEKVDNHPRLVIQYQSNSQFPQRGGFTRGFGTAWVDPDSLQVVHLEDYLVNGTTDPVTIVNFGNVTIDRTDVWMSTSYTVDTKRPDNSVNHLTMEYRNCRRYNVSVEIRPGQ